MKNNLLRTVILGTVLTLISFSFTNVYAQSITSSNEISKSNITITDGPIYEAVQHIDPSLSISENSKSGITFTKDIAIDDNTLTTKDRIRRFYWDSVQIINNADILSQLSSYNTILFLFVYEDKIESFNLSDFQDIHNFKSAYIPMGTDGEEFHDSFKAHYNAVYGGHDIQNSLDATISDFSKKYDIDGKYEVPSSFKNGYLWVFSNFNQFCGFNIVDDSITVEVLANNAKIDGQGAKDDLQLNFTSYDTFCSAAPEKMPYTTLTIKYLDASNYNTLFSVEATKDNGKWTINYSNSNNDFVTGFYS